MAEKRCEPWNMGFLTNYNYVPLRWWKKKSPKFFFHYGKAPIPKSFREGTRKRREPTKEQNDEVAL